MEHKAISNSEAYKNDGVGWKATTSNDPRSKRTTVKAKGQKFLRMKKLNYNHREISNQLLRANKSGSARQVLCRAKSKLVVLKRHAGTGNYNSNELRAAILHAQKMVDCASLKVQNLKEEELLGRKNEKAKMAGSQKKQALQRQAETKIRKMELEASRKRAQLERAEKEQYYELQRKKQEHRNDEYGQITRANREYEMSGSRNGKESVRQNPSGVCMELSGYAMQMSELKRIEQLLRQEKMQSSGTSAASGTADTASPAPEGTSKGAEGTAVLADAAAAPATPAVP